MSVSTVSKPVSPSSKKMMANFMSSGKMRWYFLKRLPTLLWWSVRIEEASLERFSVSLPYNWRTQNPFRSIYFAAMTGTAELSTGLFCMLAIRESGENISMLITGLEGQFVKKADSRVTFTCKEGEKINQAVEEAASTGQGVTVSVLSIGVNPNGEEVARFQITWSLKARKK